MSAYLQTLISGNQSFGGYLSVDGEKSFAVSHDNTYELAPGRHHFELYSTSDSARKNAKGQAWLYNNTGSSGSILDAIERQQIRSQMGEGYEFDVVVDDGEMVQVEILSKGSKLVGAPMFRTIELSPAEIAEWERKFEEWRNTPVRSPKQIKWGIALTLLGAFGFVNALNGAAGEDTVSGLLLMGGIVAVGILLLVLGMKKKIRRK